MFIRELANRLEFKDDLAMTLETILRTVLHALAWSAMMLASLVLVCAVVAQKANTNDALGGVSAPMMLGTGVAATPSSSQGGGSDGEGAAATPGVRMRWLLCDRNLRVRRTNLHGRRWTMMVIPSLALEGFCI